MSKHATTRRIHPITNKSPNESTQGLASIEYPANEIVDCVAVPPTVALVTSVACVCGAHMIPLGGVATPGVIGADAEGVLSCDLLCAICARMR